MMVTIDDETLARAVLTFCLDSADAMMYALVKGTGPAASALQLIADSGPGNHENVTAAACTSLEPARCSTSRIRGTVPAPSAGQR